MPVTERCCGFSTAQAPSVTLAVGGLAHLTLEANNQLCRDDPTAVAHRYRHLALAWGGGALSLDGDESDQDDAVLTSCTGTLDAGPWHA